MVSIIVDGVILDNFSPSVAKHFVQEFDFIEMASEKPVSECHFLNNGNLCGDTSMDTIYCIGDDCGVLMLKEDWE